MSIITQNVDSIEEDLGLTNVYNAHGKLLSPFKCDYCKYINSEYKSMLFRILDT